MSESVKSICTGGPLPAVQTFFEKSGVQPLPPACRRKGRAEGAALGCAPHGARKKESGARPAFSEGKTG